MVNVGGARLATISLALHRLALFARTEFYNITVSHHAFSIKKKIR